ncbi:MAG: glycosyltransferase family 2 protein, partial [Acidobacteriales bacterium]|nr:glycosyltransferase family 2 protein [Terriglobales bacterium]
EIAQSHGARVFTEPWKGYAAQKNSAIEKASGDWILSLDADEEVSSDLACSINAMLFAPGRPLSRPAQWLMLAGAGVLGGVSVRRPECDGFSLPRRNYFLGRWIKHGGFYPDLKLRLFRRGTGRFEERSVHETIAVNGITGAAYGITYSGYLIHHAYPTLAGYIGHMNKYSSLGAEQAAKEGKRGFSFINIVLRPLATFIYNYFFRLGFLDGREGLLLHLYHAAYTSWKYAKLWELTRESGRPSK